MVVYGIRVELTFIQTLGMTKLKVHVELICFFILNSDLHNLEQGLKNIFKNYISLFNYIYL